MSLFLNTEAASALSIFLVLPDLIKAKEKPIRGRPCNVALCLRYYLGRHIYKNNRPASVPCDPPSSPCQPQACSECGCITAPLLGAPFRGKFMQALMHALQRVWVSGSPGGADSVLTAVRPHWAVFWGPCLLPAQQPLCALRMTTLGFQPLQGSAR